MSKTLDDIDADLRRVQASLEGARAAHRHCPSTENAERITMLEALRDGVLDARLAMQPADVGA